MSSVPGRFSQLRWVHNVFSALALLFGLVLIILGLGLDGREWMAVAGGFLILLTVMGMTLMPLLIKIEANSSRQFTELRDLHETAMRNSASLAHIAENTRISDAAKSLAHRDQELDAVRAAIREDIRRRRWESAMGLVDEIEQRFGYRQEAESLREELNEARREAIQAKLTQAVEMIERHFAAHEWPRAQKEIDRLLHALPNDGKVLQLQDRLRELRELHKFELKQAWDEAVRRCDTDHAIDVLRELDQYLSPAEAKELQNSARNVFKEKLLQLGVQFRFAVNERRWQDALTIGLELIRDFPNARMASEVREALDTLRERARQAAADAAEAEPARS